MERSVSDARRVSGSATLIGRVHVGVCGTLMWWCNWRIARSRSQSQLVHCAHHILDVANHSWAGNGRNGRCLSVLLSSAL